MSDAAAPLMERQLQILGELAEIGLDVARAVGRLARDHDPAADQAAAPAPAGDLALAYARVSRAVRLTLMLQAQLAEDEAAQAQARLRPEPAPATPEDVRKARVERIVERLVMAEHGHDEDMADTLVAETAERLDDDDIYGDLMQRPMSEIVARLCRDLGLAPDWRRLREELWARAEVASGDVGAPLSPYLPREAAGGEPVVEERLVEGASGKRSLTTPLFADTA